jgi:hypothetical protein
MGDSYGVNHRACGHPHRPFTPCPTPMEGNSMSNETEERIDRLEASLTEHKWQYDYLLRILEGHGLISVAKH